MRRCSLLLLCSTTLQAANITALVQDRAAIELVYYKHRLGQKPPIEQATPPRLIEDLVWEDQRKEAVLHRVYNVDITPALLEAEVQRINSTTRAPEMLAEIKNALGNDQARFAEAFAKPFLVERLLRDKFDNDDTLHGTRRREMELVRQRLLSQVLVSNVQTSPGVTQPATNNVGAKLTLLKAGHTNRVSETTWQLGRRPAGSNAPAAQEQEIRERFGPEAQSISPERAGAREKKFYFEDLPIPLQNIIVAQLRRPGDLSAVIEAPEGFLLYLCTARTTDTLSAAVLSLPKCSYDQWLAEQKP